MKPFNLEEYLANPSKKIITRDGRNVRIICTDREGDCPIVALVEKHDQTIDIVEGIFTYPKSGIFMNSVPSDVDLFFDSKKHECWVNVYMNCNERSLGALHSSKKDALEVAKANDNYVATVKIEWEE